MFACACVFAAASGIVIKSADLQLADEAYKLSADVEISFDEAIEEAINKGVPLNFLVEFQVVSPRKYWFDDEIVTATTNFTLSYHALSRQYLVSHNGHQNSYETLSEAKLELMELDDWKVLEKSQIEKGTAYKAVLLMRLDLNRRRRVRTAQRRHTRRGGSSPHWQDGHLVIVRREYCVRVQYRSRRRVQDRHRANHRHVGGSQCIDRCHCSVAITRRWRPSSSGAWSVHRPCIRLDCLLSSSCRNAC